MKGEMQIQMQSSLKSRCRLCDVHVHTGMYVQGLVCVQFSMCMYIHDVHTLSIYQPLTSIYSITCMPENLVGIPF